MRMKRTGLLVVALAAALVVGGCSSDSDGSGGGGGTPPPQQGSDPYGPAGASDSAQPSGGQAASGSNELTAKDIAFHPTSLTFEAGSQVSFKLRNEDSVEHNFTLDGVEGAEKDVEGGKDVTVSFTAPAAGSYKFHCEYHPRMSGTATVQ